MTFELTATHCFNQLLTPEDVKNLNISQVHADFITFVVNDNHIDSIFELPFYVKASYPSDSYDTTGQIILELNNYSPEESNTAPFDWKYVNHIKKAYFGDIHYYRNEPSCVVDITSEVIEYLHDKYGVDIMGNLDHFENCTLYNQELGLEVSVPDMYSDRLMDVL